MIKDLLRRIELCESKINYEKHKDKYLEKLVYSYPILTLEEERELFKLYKTTKDKIYKDIIFKCHLRDVHDVCTDTSSYRSDLISEGIVLLCEFIDYFDYSMPYDNFTNVLKTRLTVLYNDKSMENNKSLDTEMSLQELAGLEKNGKCLTDTNEVEPVVEEPKEELEIINDKEYLLSKSEGNKIFNKIFKTKKLIYKPSRRIRPEDREY